MRNIIISKRGGLLTILFVGSFFFISASTCKAQTAEVGSMIGICNYTGDLSPSLNIMNSRPAVNIFFKYNFDYFFTLRTNILWGGVAAKDKLVELPFNSNRNIDFKGQIGEFSGLFEYNFFPVHSPKIHQKGTPYILGGLSVLSFSSESTSREINRGSDLQIAIPFGVGYKYALNPMWDLVFEFVARRTTTDFLDGTHDKANEAQNGFYDDKDWFYFIGGGISYKFYGVKCPDGTGL